MARYKHLSRKKRLAKLNRQTRWAPFWVRARKHGMQRGQHIHPSRMTESKRSWRRTKTKA